MIKETIIKQDVMIKQKFCDDCGMEVIMGMACSVAKCEICGKDLCDSCIGHEDYNWGDYRTVYCKTCWNIGTKYRESIQKLKDKIDNLNDVWYEKCRNFKK